MNTNYTPIFSLSFLHPNQTQKELLINNVLAKIDCLLGQSVESRSIKTGPDPMSTLCKMYIVPYAADGFWNEWPENRVALSLYGQWHMIHPRDGMMFWVKDESSLCVYSGTSWYKLTSL